MRALRVWTGGRLNTSRRQGWKSGCQLDTLMQNQGLTKTTLAKRMKTSRAQLDRLLDPDNESVTLGTLTRAAQAVGRQLRMELV